MKILLLSDSHSYIDDRILEYAKKAILFSIDMGYVGFYNGNGLFYRPQRNKSYTGDYPL